MAQWSGDSEIYMDAFSINAVRVDTLNLWVTKPIRMILPERVDIDTIDSGKNK